MRKGIRYRRMFWEFHIFRDGNVFFAGNKAHGFLFIKNLQNETESYNDVFCLKFSNPKLFWKEKKHKCKSVVASTFKP